ncbi:uncharacterized protein At5g39570-like isoform X3 [Magnolia sinica]|uniref:uncharacterized protein At5g39570-like isoform X3 n=1 Tax=Magnolia sinica TaxID=86752 RepID=UPI002657D3A5|nr:uncharacterized protein At5g39570-like isoform X3 [Magnolia sinica]
MKSTGRILRRAFSKVNHSKRVYYSSAPETVVSSAEGIKVNNNFYDDDFPEYDPTPYDGGLDLVLTYGKPLPASDATCYPPSLQDPNSSTLKGFSYGSIPSPYGKEGADHGPPRSGQVLPRSSDGEKPLSDAGSGNSPNNPKPNNGNGSWEGGIFSHGIGGNYGCGHSNNNEPVVPYQGEEESYGWEIQAVDDYRPNYAEPCVNPNPFYSWLFASQEDENNYHPCDANNQNSGNHRNGMVEYLFGYLNPNDESRDKIQSYGNPTYVYEKHRPEEAHYGQDDYSALLLFQEPVCYEDHQEEERFQEPIYYEDYQEEEHTHSKYVSSQQEPIYYKDYQEEKQFQGPIYYEDYQGEEHTQSKYVSSQHEPIYYEDYQEEKRFQEPIYYEDYQEEEHTQSKYQVSHYERHSHEQHHYGQDEYSNELWFQKPSYYKPY